MNDVAQSLGHLVRAGEQPRRDSDTERGFSACHHSPQPLLDQFCPHSQIQSQAAQDCKPILARLILPPNFAYVRKLHVPFVFLSNLGEDADDHP